jgi:transcriptional regulator with XRE-family HTH domain
MSTTKFRNVADAAADLAGDQAVVSRVNKEIQRNAVVSLLLELRVRKGLTQEQIAEAMSCDPSTVSRIESDSDKDLKWSHICGYINALGVQMNVLIDDGSLPAADRIKQCVFKIDDDLKKLADLAKEVGGEDEIAHEIDRFYRQVLFNFVTRFSENYSAVRSVVRIPSCPKPLALRDSPEEMEEASSVDQSNTAQALQPA